MKIAPRFNFKIRLRGIFLRFLLILFLPIIIIQLINAFIFYDRHWENVSMHLTNAVGHELLYIANLLDRQDYKLATDALIAFKMQVARNFYDAPPYRKLRAGELESLNNFLQNNISLGAFAIINGKTRNVEVYLPLKSGQYFVNFNRKRVVSSTTNLFGLSMVVTSIIILILSFIFLRNQVRNIIYLARVVDRFGKGQEVAPIKPTGPYEIRSLANSFNRMQKRIMRSIQHRSRLLSHISHDLRTPLTRMRFKAEMLRDPQDKQMISDEIAEMEGTINSYLEFAKAEGNEEMQIMQIDTMLEKAIKNIINKHVVFNNQAAGLRYMIKAVAFERAINNILDNAVKYSKNEIQVNLKRRGRGIVISFEDDGKGVAKEQFKHITKPFVKGDESSSYGLGLAIVKSIINDHGGRVSLRTSKNLGGLKVLITLPM